MVRICLTLFGESGRITGVVERVRTGEKERVDGLEAVSAAIARMLGANPQGTAPPVYPDGTEIDK
jgi:hypothetical protein